MLFMHQSQRFLSVAETEMEINMSEGLEDVLRVHEWIGRTPRRWFEGHYISSSGLRDSHSFLKLDQSLYSGVGRDC
jgi:hypothetical protein